MNKTTHKMMNLSGKIMLFIGTMLFTVSNVFALEDTLDCGNGIIPIPVATLRILHYTYLIIKIATPLVLIVMGTLDFIRAIMGSDESEIKKKQRRFLKRLFSAAMVFLVLSLVEFLFSFLTRAGFSDVTGCIDAVVNGNF